MDVAVDSGGGGETAAGGEAEGKAEGGEGEGGGGLGGFSATCPDGDAAEGVADCAGASARVSRNPNTLRTTATAAPTPTRSGLFDQRANDLGLVEPARPIRRRIGLHRGQRVR